MKKVLHFVAVVAIALLAFEPVQGVLACASVAPGNCTAVCPMADAAPDCPMARSSAMQGCPPDCCRRANSQTAVLAVGLVRQRAALTGAVTTDLATQVQATTGRPRFVSWQAPITSPPRYKLFRVFRI